MVSYDLSALKCVSATLLAVACLVCVFFLGMSSAPYLYAIVFGGLALSLIGTFYYGWRGRRSQKRLALICMTIGLVVLLVVIALLFLPAVG